MAFVRSWREPRALRGPYPITTDDVPALNRLFSEAFTERYRRDGMVGVRVPHLNPRVWGYAIADAARGAMLWRDDEGRIAAFNLVHASGTEGWMGPLAVAPEFQGVGLGKMVVTSGLEWIRARQARVIGLETMPRTVENIGFYSSLGFVPASITVTLTLDAAPATHLPLLLGALDSNARATALAQCGDLVRALIPGYDYTREIVLTAELELGDTLLVYDGPELSGFALCHTVPLVEGRGSEELRVLKLVAKDESALHAMLPELGAFARRAGTRRVAVRVQGSYPAAYRALVQRGARVRWTDLRMTAADSPEVAPAEGVVLSNWEI